jgi:FkbM family methyltransferase
MMTTYSQNKEDIAVLNYFGKDFKGLVLDIGANDGITLSNSRLLIESGWNGVLVEPSPKAYAKLLENKPKTNSQVIALNYAIGTEEKDAILFESNEHLSKNDVALLSSVNESETIRWKNQKFTKVEVEMITFEMLLDLIYDWFENDIDFISIDAEGLDLDILKQINLTDLNVKCLCIEHNSNKQVRAEIIEYCLQHGLNTILLENSENIILVK